MFPKKGGETSKETYRRAQMVKTIQLNFWLKKKIVVFPLKKISVHWEHME